MSLTKSQQCDLLVAYSGTRRIPFKVHVQLPLGSWNYRKGTDTHGDVYIAGDG